MEYYDDFEYDTADCIDIFLVVFSIIISVVAIMSHHFNLLYCVCAGLGFSFMAYDFCDKGILVKDILLGILLVIVPIVNVIGVVVVLATEILPKLYLMASPSLNTILNKKLTPPWKK